MSDRPYWIYQETKREKVFNWVSCIGMAFVVLSGGGVGFMRFFEESEKLAKKPVINQLTPDVISIHIDSQRISYQDKRVQDIIAQVDKLCGLERNPPTNIDGFKELPLTTKTPYCAKLLNQ